MEPEKIDNSGQGPLTVVLLKHTIDFKDFVSNSIVMANCS